MERSWRASWAYPASSTPRQGPVRSATAIACGWMARPGRSRSLRGREISTVSNGSARRFKEASIVGGPRLDVLRAVRFKLVSSSEVIGTLTGLGTTDAEVELGQLETAGLV